MTGAGSGLGKATAQWFVNRGSRVVLLDLPTSEGKKVAKSFGKNCIFAPADVRNPTSRFIPAFLNVGPFIKKRQKF